MFKFCKIINFFIEFRKSWIYIFLTLFQRVLIFLALLKEIALFKDSYSLLKCTGFYNKSFIPQFKHSFKTRSAEWPEQPIIYKLGFYIRISLVVS